MEEVLEVSNTEDDPNAVFVALVVAKPNDGALVEAVMDEPNIGVDVELVLNEPNFTDVFDVDVLDGTDTVEEVVKAVVLDVPASAEPENPNFDVVSNGVVPNVTVDATA